MSLLTGGGYLAALWLLIVIAALIWPAIVVYRMMAADRTVKANEYRGYRDSIESLSDANLKKYLKMERERFRALNEKLQRWTIALPILVTVGGLVWPSVLEVLDAAVIRYIVSGLFFSSVVCLFGGTYLSFLGYMPRKRYGYGPGYLKDIETGDETARAAMVGALMGFMRECLIRNNQASAAAYLTMFGILFIVIAIMAYFIGTTFPV